MSGFDYIKLASFIESVPALSVRETLGYISILRADQKPAYGESDIDPNAERHQMQSLDAEWVAAIGCAHIGNAIASIVRTPRAIKSALRRTRSAWSQLHGEVDFDDLLLVCILRESNHKVVIYKGAGNEHSPQYSVEVFRLLARHIHWLRDHSRRDSDRDKPTAEQAALLQLVESEHPAGRVIASLRL